MHFTPTATIPGLVLRSIDTKKAIQFTLITCSSSLHSQYCFDLADRTGQSAYASFSTAFSGIKRTQDTHGSSHFATPQEFQTLPQDTDAPVSISMVVSWGIKLERALTPIWVTNFP